MSGKPERVHDRPPPMTEDEWIEYYLARAPQITEEQWEDTIAILELTGNRKRQHADRQPPT